MNIIVASSNIFRRELSCFILSEEGYTVHEASDSAALLQYLDTVQPDLVLLDTRLGGMRYEDAVRYIRQHNTSVPVMILTASSSFFDTTSVASNAVGDALLTWPYQADDLVAHVDALLRRLPSTSTARTPAMAFSSLA
jgi:DNA-binding response OmpR family regulator